MKNSNKRGLLSLLLAIAMVMSLVTVPAYAAPSGGSASGGGSAVTTGVLFDMDTGDEGVINLCQGRSFGVIFDTGLTGAEAQAAISGAQVYLIYDDTDPYVDGKLYPNHTKGGALSEFVYSRTSLFTAPTFEVLTDPTTHKASILVTFDSKVVLSGGSAPHSNGGAYLDLCGWYDLVLKLGDETMGTVEGVKITPYDSFHTMQELYESMDALVSYASAKTSLYVEKFSMGKSQGGNGLESLDMPYLILAKSKAAVDKWQSVKALAESDPTTLLAQIKDGSIGEYQVPILYSNVHANEVAAADGVLEFAWTLVEAAAADGKLGYKNLTGFTDLGREVLATQMGPKGGKNSIAVPDLVADTATYLGFIKGASNNSGSATNSRVSSGAASKVLDLDAYYVTEDVEVNVNDLLDDVFFLLVPEENVEGRTYITRHSSGGLDLNRDNSFQTQAETTNMARFIAQWNPVSFTEFHGRVTGFQCEPCDPPHEPNFEYDLLAEHLITGGEAFGIAAVASNDTYNSYCMPQRDYLAYTGNGMTAEWDPWDDMSTSYTPQYAMLHGTVAYTVELPGYNDPAVDLVVYGSLGQANYIAAEKAGYLTAQTKILERGVKNANSDAFELVGQWFADRFDVEGAEAELFRPEYTGKGQNGNFYPECYIIPLSGENQRNLDAAKQMLDYLSRNGVKIMRANFEFTYDGVIYPVGTAVVSMYQAKRSVANGALYNGTFITTWPTLYSEGITAFNKTRGFDMVTCAEPEAYQDIAKVCSERAVWSVPSSDISSPNVILLNSSEAAVAAVNALLKEGKKVSVITTGDYRGSFVVSRADYNSVAKDYLLTARALTAAQTVKPLTKAPVIYVPGKPANNTSGFVYTSLVGSATGYNYDMQAMALMGFTVTDDPAQADIIVGASGLSGAALEQVKNGKPYLGYSSSVTNAVSRNLVPVTRTGVGGGSMDALAYVKYPNETAVNASYIAEGDDILYGYGAGYYSSIPEGAVALVTIDGSKLPLEGFMSSNGTHLDDFLNSSVQAFTYQGKSSADQDIDITLFANTLTNKVHQRDEYGFIANAAFATVTGSESETIEAPRSSSTSSGVIGGSSGAAAPAPSAAPAKDEDGSATKTETDKATGTVTETTTKADGTVQVVETKTDGTVTETITDAEGNKTVEVSTADGAVSFTETRADGVEAATEIAADGAVTATVTLPEKVDEATVTIPTKAEVTPGTVAAIVNEDGSLTVVQNSQAGEDGVTVTLSDSAKLVVLDNAKTFPDVVKGSWYSDAVAFTSAREMVGGVSDGSFAPEMVSTRGMVTTILARYMGADTTGGARWYDKGMEWAKAHGISDGTSPENVITREQLAAMLYRHAGEPEVEGAMDMAGYADAADVSPWADTAMRWAVVSGIIGGNEKGELKPLGNCTRAELVTMLMRYLRK